MLEAQPRTESLPVDPAIPDAPAVPAAAPRDRWRVLVPAAILLLLTAWAAFVRLRALNGQFWVDEGIAVGIASHPLHEIPGLLRQDGSPPLYYVMLHVWMAWFGEGERPTHLLSVIFGILGVPLVAWAAWPFGRKAALIAAGLTAFAPLLSLYSDETRMYSLLFCEAVLVAGTFVRAFVLGRHRWAIGFSISLALTLYTHSWGLFLAIVCTATLAVMWWRERERRRELLLWGGGALAVAGLLFLPWLPELLDQARTTAAPWSHAPRIKELIAAFSAMLGGRPTLAGLVIAAAIGLRVRKLDDDTRTKVLVLLALSAGTLILGWGYSRFVSPAWADRYDLIALGPLLMALALCLARAGWAAVVILVVCAASWLLAPYKGQLLKKSNVKTIALKMRHEVTPGTLVISTQPEQVPVIYYYFRRYYSDLRYLTPLGTPKEPGVMDWRGASTKLDHARYHQLVSPQIASATKGSRIVLLIPKLHPGDGSWARRLYNLAHRWHVAMDRDPRLQVLHVVKTSHGRTRTDLTGYIFRKR